ncbi:metal-dependent hydrolase [Rhodovulum sp. NI22]|nr:metal-dependent hydrolase [Rhodovulum sp. NI22]
MMSLLEINDISVNYGAISAIRNVSFTMEAGRIITVIGPNGAGKTTLLKSIAALLPYSGSVAFQGRSVDRLDVQARVRSGMVLVPESRELFTQMSVQDNLDLGAYARRDGAANIRRDLDQVYDLFPRLRERMGQAAGTLSGGERQMLALGRALMSAPRLLMLDEPSLGLAPIVVREIFRIIARLRELDVSVLLVEQNARAALQTADYGYVLETGEIAGSGPSAELLADPMLINAYLGGKKPAPATA